MSFKPSDSIYRTFIMLIEKNPGLPYDFQTSDDGSTDVNYLFWKDDLSVNRKEELAMEATDIVMSVVHEDSFIDSLRNFLEKYPLYTFLTFLNRRIGLLLSEEFIDKENLYTLGIKLATDSDHTEEVRVGIIILGHFENDVTRKIIRTLGLHSDFTIYAIEASDHFLKSNKFVYELAQNTKGYGKLAAITRLRPFFTEQQLWLFKYGAMNENLSTMSAIICLEKVDMTSFYQKLILDNDSYPTLSYIIAHACEHSSIMEFRVGKSLIEKFVYASKVYSKTFIDLMAIIQIDRSMEDYLSEGNKAYNDGSKSLSLDKITKMKTVCDELIKQRRWNYVVNRQLEAPVASTTLILQAIKRIGIEVHFNHFIPIMVREPFSLKIMEYTLIDRPSKFFNEVKEFILRFAPPEVFEANPLAIDTEEIVREHIPDIWLVYVLKAHRIKYEYDEELFCKCLTCRFPDVRKEAIGLIRMFKNRWGEQVEPLLRRACDMEPVEDIKNRFKRLLGIQVNKKEKDQQYIDIGNLRILPSYNDIELGYSIVAGTFYRDLTILEGEITYGDILYLVRELDNVYDEKAVMVVTKEGYVIGYLPKAENGPYAERMDQGEKLYAILKSDTLENKPRIQIMLSRAVEPGTIIRFPNN